MLELNVMCVLKPRLGNWLQTHDFPFPRAWRKAFWDYTEVLSWELHLGFAPWMNQLKQVTEGDHLLNVLLDRNLYEFYVKIILSFRVLYAVSTETTLSIQRDEANPMWCVEVWSDPMVLPSTLLHYWSTWVTREATDCGDLQPFSVPLV